ncbi:MAG: hypothetical protein ACTSQS_18025 [Promethearchaeota archaeon]
MTENYKKIASDMKEENCKIWAKAFKNITKQLNIPLKKKIEKLLN